MHICSACFRHVREERCPFCDAEAECVRHEPSATGAAVRAVGRAAVVAGALTLAACAAYGGPVALYGIPVDSGPPVDATSESAVETGSDAAPADVAPDAAPDGPVAAYGIPPGDAGSDH